MESFRKDSVYNPSLDKMDYTPKQLIFPLNVGISIPKEDPFHSFNELIEGVNLKKYLKPSLKGPQEYDDWMMLKIVLFAYMNNITSLRKIANACRVDIRFITLAQSQAPSFMAFQRFINQKLKGTMKDIFLEINREILQRENVDTTVLYIDGTKIEANATKFSFVWKKAVLNYQKRLQIKIKEHVDQANELLGTTHGCELQDLITLSMKLLRQSTGLGLSFVYGKGCRKTSLQRCYEGLREAIEKEQQYRKHLRICGERNSYSKTDPDATFMHGKEDYYSKTGIFKPYYNVQIGVSHGYILWTGLYPNPTDTKTFIPFLETYYDAYGEYPEKPVADAGYGSYENYLYCVSKGMGLYQKYNQYAKEKTFKFKKQWYHVKNMKEEHLAYVAQDGVRYEYAYDRHETKGSLPRLIQVYQCVNPEAAQHPKLKPSHTLSKDVTLLQLQAKAKENLESEEGFHLRVQRSIQVEGAFGEAKHNMEYKRFHRRGKENVENELFLIFCGQNLRKYHNTKMNRQRH